MTKYPYIKDKKMYAAVMGACRYIRETGYFNKAVSYYAGKYGLQEEALAAEIRKRQAAGQKNRKTAQYKYFVIVRRCCCEANQEWEEIERSVAKATSKENIEKRCAERNWREQRKNDYGGSYAPVFYSDVFGPYGTESEARAALEVVR